MAFWSQQPCTTWTSQHARCLSKNAFECPRQPTGIFTLSLLAFIGLHLCAQNTYGSHATHQWHAHFKTSNLTRPMLLCSLANSLTRSLTRLFVRQFVRSLVRSSLCIFHSFDDDGVYRPFVCAVNGGALAVAWCCICYHLLTGALSDVCIYGNNFNSTISNIASFESVESVVSWMSLR